MYDDLEEECFVGTHRVIMWTISIPGLICYAFGIPLLGLYALRKFKQTLAEAKLHSDPMVYKNMH